MSGDIHVATILSMQKGKKNMQRNKSRKVTETTVKLNAFGINDSSLQDVLENFEKSLN